jgi:hypothetical protein
VSATPSSTYDSVLELDALDHHRPHLLSATPSSTYDSVL